MKVGFLALVVASAFIVSQHQVPPTNASIYVIFQGNCREAMEEYKSIFGGNLSLTTVGESPMKHAFPTAMQHRVVNAQLTNGRLNLSASDWLRPNEKPIQGNTMCVYLHGGMPAELRSYWDKLVKGAKVSDPLSVKPFGTYGALTDRFGVRWMFQTDLKDRL